MDALPLNTHLRYLDVSCILALYDRHHSLSEAFVRNTVMPAVKANTSLRELKIHGYEFNAARRSLVPSTSLAPFNDDDAPVDD